MYSSTDGTLQHEVVRCLRIDHWIIKRVSSDHALTHWLLRTIVQRQRQSDWQSDKNHFPIPIIIERRCCSRTIVLSYPAFLVEFRVATVVLYHSSVSALPRQHKQKLRDFRVAPYVNLFWNMENTNQTTLWTIPLSVSLLMETLNPDGNFIPTARSFKLLWAVAGLRPAAILTKLQRQQIQMLERKLLIRWTLLISMLETAKTGLIPCPQAQPPPSSWHVVRNKKIWIGLKKYSCWNGATLKDETHVEHSRQKKNSLRRFHHRGLCSLW